MKILYLSTNYAPKIGGAETYIRELAAGMAARGHDVTVFTDAPDIKGAAITSEQGGFRLVRDGTYWTRLLEPANSPWEQMAFGILPGLATHVDLSDIDVIHANSQDTALLGSILRLQGDTPLVVTSHEVGRAEQALGVGRMRLVVEVLPVDAFIAGSEYYRRELSAFTKSRIHRIYLGVDTVKFRPAPARRMRAGRMRVVCLARFKARKGLLDFIDGAALVAQSRDDVDFLLAGSNSSASSEYADAMRRRVRERGLEDRLIIRDDLPHDAIPAVLQDADLVVQPSRLEGLGLAVLEAMACGRPVVACQASGVDEVITNGYDGILLPPENPGALAEAITVLLGDPTLRSRLGQAARGTVLNRFDLTRTITETEQLYQSLTSGEQVSASLSKGP